MNQYDASKIKEALYLSIEEKLEDYRTLVKLSKNDYSENDTSYIFKNEIIDKEFLNNPNTFISKQIDLLFEVPSSTRLDEIKKDDGSLDE